MREFMAVTKALADETRVRVLLALADRELCVCEIIELLELAPSTVSKHMSILRQAGIVEGRKNGRWTYYRLVGRDAPQEVRTAIEWVRESLSNDSRVRADAQRVTQMVESRVDACER